MVMGIESNPPSMGPRPAGQIVGGQLTVPANATSMKISLSSALTMDSVTLAQVKTVIDIATDPYSLFGFKY